MKNLLAALLLALSLGAHAQTLVRPLQGGTGVSQANTKTVTLGGPFVTTGSGTMTIAGTGTPTLSIGAGGTLGTSAYTPTATPTTLGLVIGTNVQAYNANLTAINQALTTTSSPTFGVTNSTRLALTGTNADTQALSLTATMAPVANNQSQAIYVAPTFTEASSGTHALLAGTFFDQPTITAGAAAVTEASTVYIAAAPNAAGAANYSLRIAAGAARLDGAVLLPGLATGSAATVGTLCQTVTTGDITVNTTLACLASSGRYKQNIHSLDIGLREVMALRPVAYELKPEFNPTGLGEMPGLVAEEVATVDARLVGLDPDGAVQGVRYMQMVALAIKAIQEQQAQIEALKAAIDMLLPRVAAR